MTKLLTVAMQLQAIRAYLQEELDELIDLRDRVAKVERELRTSQHRRRATSRWDGPIRLLASDAWQNRSGRLH